MKRTLLLALCAALAGASAAAAQNAPPSCPGAMQVIRVSKVKPGKMDVFMGAMKDQQAWYAAKGLPDRITYGSVLGQGGGASDMVVTVHDKVAATGAPHDNDAKWDAFVAKFRDSSDIVSGGPTCMTDAPK